MEHLKHAPAVHQNMMEIPQEFVAVVGSLQQRTAQQRRFGQIEALCEIGAKNFFQILLLDFRRIVAPIVMHQRNFGPAIHHLHRLFHTVPNKRCAQNRMMFHDALPGALECQHLQIAVQRKQRLIAIQT
ncbi:MAG: hypothetical protein ALAOOOJD_01348 [bacterium]|nr:hypothetical protein [bacterium]